MFDTRKNWALLNEVISLSRHDKKKRDVPDAAPPKGKATHTHTHTQHNATVYCVCGGGNQNRAQSATETEIHIDGRALPLS